MSGDEGAADRGAPGHDRAKILRAADSFDGRDHVMSLPAWELQVIATATSAVRDHPGFVPDEYLSSLTGDDLRSPGAQPAILAAELCTAGMWQRIDGGYRVLDTEAIQVCVDRVRELREETKRTRCPKRELQAQMANGMTATTGVTRFGQRTGHGAAASFRCAACGEMAAVVKADPPLGHRPGAGAAPPLAG